MTVLSDKSMRIYEVMTQSEGLIADVVADPHSSKIYIAEDTGFFIYSCSSKIK